MERPIYLKQDVDKLHKMITDYCQFCGIEEEEIDVPLFLHWVNSNEFHSKSEGRRIRIQSEIRELKEKEYCEICGRIMIGGECIKSPHSLLERGLENFDSESE